jgi:surfactin synthase thioesterase subunit/acyl carrier protein
VIADVGMAADEDFYRQNLERNGLSTIHSDHCLELLGLLLETGRVQTTVCPIDLDVWLKFNPAGKDARLKDLLSTARDKQEATRVQGAEEAALRVRLDTLDEAGQNELAEERVRNALAQVLRIQATKLDPSRSLTALGADSLMAIELKNRLEGLGLAMSVTQLLNRQSVNTLSKALLQALGHGARAQEHDAKPVKHAESTWFVCRDPRGDAKVRLICFPYAGGGPSVYSGWPELLPDWVEVLAVNLPGRGTRSDEPPLESITQAAEAMLPDLLPLLDRPFAFFGHCMGAILMYEVAQRLEQVHGKVAAHIFASGCMAPHLYNSPIVHEQDDGAFLDVLRLISFGGTLALIEDPELRKSMFPLLRADFRAVVEYGESYRAVAPLRAPITGLAAENDLFAAPKAMQAWGRYTARGYDLAQLPGDHYFLESDRTTVTKIVSALLEPSNHACLEAAALPALANVVWNKPNNDQLGRAPEPTRVAFTARRNPSRSTRTHVLCFPPACVSAAEFPLPAATSDFSYEAIEWRGKMPLGSVRSVAEMVSIAHEAVQGRLDGSAVLYGHCLGAIVAYELALRLQREERSVPAHLIVAGVVGPHLYVAPDAHKLPTEKLLELLSVLKYPFAERLKRDPAFQQARLGMIRADLEAMSAYQYQEGEPLDAPITAVSMRHDLWSYPLRTESWRHHTKQRAEVVHWPGDHYYNMRHPEKIHELVRELARSSVAAE